ncbi:MAG: PIN domain-containing protein [Planctomycetes bacterium]|nr:PIN domain-containing protein [Planctomycetota bacterium]
MAMMDDNPILVDACILVEATNTRRAKHLVAQNWLTATPGLYLSSQTVREYLVVATRPVELNGLGLSVVTGWANMDGFLEFIGFLPDDRPVLPVFRELARHHSISGKRLHDAWLVATAHVHKLKGLCTLNLVDFAAFSDELKLVTL